MVVASKAPPRSLCIVPVTVAAVPGHLRRFDEGVLRRLVGVGGEVVDGF